MAGTTPTAGTYQTYTQIGQREDLTDIIFDISPTETPVSRNSKRENVSAVLHEWQTDALAAAVTTNTQAEGYSITTFDTSAPTVRIGNRCVISSKDVAVSGTADAVNKAGRRSELRFQLMKRGKELKRDMEYMICAANANTGAGSSGTARNLASLLHWVKTNVSMGTDGTNPTWTSGVPLNARTDATGVGRTFTETILKAVMQSCFTNGAEPTTLVVGPVNKQRVSGFAGIADQRRETGNKAAVIIGTADIYLSDFGELHVVPNRFQRERDAWFLDFDFVALGFLRGIKQEELAKTGDATKYHILAEWTFIVRNELALGLAADLLTT